MLNNTSKIPLKNLHLVCTKPGIISFGKPRQNTLFELPLIAKPDPPFAITSTVSEPVREYMDLMPVPLPDGCVGQLAAGASMTLPLWVRGGHQSLDDGGGGGGSGGSAAHGEISSNKGMLMICMF